MLGQTQTASLPAIHAWHLVEVVRRWGVTPEELLGPLGMERAQVEDPHMRLPLSEVERLVDRARRLTGEPGLGIYMGLAMRISWHGYLGFAAMTAGTIGDALGLASRFIPTRTTALGLRVEEEGGLASVILEERAPLGTARDVIVFALLIGISELGNALTTSRLEGQMEVAFPEPPYFARFASLRPGRVHFDRPRHRLLFDRSVLSLPLAMADPAAQQLAAEQCERELAALGFADRASTQVRALLGRTHDDFPSQTEVARALGLSIRTLKRRLAEEGTSFSELLDEERRQRALVLLRTPELTLEEIAVKLGYSDASSFSRAFSRWTGQSPRAFRKG